MLERVPKYTLRKLSVGLASVMIGSGILMNSPKVLADTINPNEGTSTAVQPSSQDKDNSEPSTQSGATQDENIDSNAAVQERSDNSVTEPATTTNAEEKVVATNTQDTTQDKDKQTNANETTQNTTNVDKKDTEVTPTNDATTATPKTTAKVNAPAAPTAMKAAATAETPDPTVPDNSANTAIINDKNSLEKIWLETSTARAQVYTTVKGTDQKVYVSSYAEFGKRLNSLIFTNRFDPNSLELHIEYQVLKDRVQNFIVNWGDWLRLDTSRIGKDGLTFTTDTGEKVAYTLTPGWGKYKTYDEWLSEGQDMSKINALKIGNNLKAGTNFVLTVPLKYIGRTDGTKQFNNVQVVDYGQPNANMVFDFIELHPEQIDTPEAPTTDKESVTTGIYNNPLATATDWYKTEHGEYVAYYTAKGKDGKTYVTGYVAANGKSESIINVDQIDLNTLEYHMIYRNGDEEVAAGISASFADGKTLVVDASRIGADGIRLKSQQGWSYNNGGYRENTSGRLYYSWEDFLKNHNGSVDNLVGINMNASAFKPGDTIEVVVPVRYIGKLSDQVQSLEFKSEARKDVSVKLYFTTVRKDLSQVKQVVLLPTEFMGEQPGQSNWKLVKEIEKDMPNGWEAIKISNFPTYKGSFNMDSLPKGDLPSVVYGSAQYFVDLQEIQKIFANHGYTVKYANNNGKAQEMPFYGYVTLPLALIDGGGKPVAPSIWTIQVQAVPAIILNKDQHYVADPNAKPWDTTSMIDEIYAADDAGQRKTRDQLEKLPKTDVDISYEYQAPGAATAAPVDKVDLTKAGVYTVTYSHTYADGRVVKDSRKVYVDDVKQETKDITRTIIVHEPNGTDQKVIQKATLTREVILYAPTGKIKSVGEWSTAKWERYSAPEFKGYTPAPAQIDETAVNKDTQDTTVEISYTANEITKPETKDITRTIIVHEPNGTDQKVIQKATLTREVILYAPTGKIKSVGEWSTAKWERYSAPEFKGYTPAPAQIDETTVNENTQDTTVEISYTANETPEQPDNSKDKGNNDNNGGNNSDAIVPINPSDNNSNNSNNAPTDNKKTDDTKKDNTGKKITKETPKKVKNNKSNKTKSTTTSKSNQSSKAKRTTKSGTISPKAVALANTTAGLATSAKANMENGIAKNNSQNSQTLPQTGENESKVAFAVAGLLAAALGIFGIAINHKKEN
ncbi:MAG: YSIRK-type signal peptide-containing protein [Lactobacillus crispatus]|nr:YSIRK-type signal peptide-containing protein [Lactobacillus crispatus]